MVFNNLLRHPKPQTSSYIFLGGKKGLEDSSKVGGRDSRTIIGDDNPHTWNSPISILPAPIALSVNNPDADGAVKIDRINAVAQQIGENLAQFTCKPENFGFRAGFQVNVDSPVLGL